MEQVDEGARPVELRNFSYSGPERDPSWIVSVAAAVDTVEVETICSLRRVGSCYQETLKKVATERIANDREKKAKEKHPFDPVSSVEEASQNVLVGTAAEDVTMKSKNVAKEVLVEWVGRGLCGVLQLAVGLVQLVVVQSSRQHHSLPPDRERTSSTRHPSRLLQQHPYLSSRLGRTQRSPRRLGDEQLVLLSIHLHFGEVVAILSVNP